MMTMAISAAATPYYDPQVDYLYEMANAAAANDVTLGSELEQKRNLKIDAEGLGGQYAKTNFFGSGKSVEQILEAIWNYEPKLYSWNDVVMMAKVMYLEARGIKSQTELSCIGWTILNRVDAGYGSIYKVITSPGQFAYSGNARTVNDWGVDLTWLANDVLSKWESEKYGCEVWRTLPKGYLWYAGDGSHNYFRNAYKGGSRWNYSWGSPYDT